MAAAPCPDSTGTAGEVKKIFLTPFLPLFCPEPAEVHEHEVVVGAA